MDHLRSAAICAPGVPHVTLDPPLSDGPRRTFVDDDHQLTFEQQGYAVVPFIDGETLGEIRAIWQDVGPAPGDDHSGYFPGNVSSSQAWKRSVIEQVAPLVESRIEALCDRHHAFHMTFMTKWPGPNGVLQVHQDPTMVETESFNRTLNLWCPLNSEEADPLEMGMVRVLPGSHRLPSGSWYRARGGHHPSGLERIEAELYERHMRPVVPAPGDALAIDHRLVHCSWPNRTDVPRVVLAIGLRPTEAASVHIDLDPTGKMSFYRVDDEYFVRHPDVDISDYPLIHTAQCQPAPEVSLEDVARLVAAATGDDAPSAAEAPAASPRPRRAGSPGRSSVLQDPRLDSRLVRDGFVKVPLLTPRAAADLRSRYLELRGESGEGFEVDFWNPSTAFRRATDAAIAATTDEALSWVFSAHQPFLRNFLCKWPGRTGRDDFPEAPHRDWMYTDESSGERSYVVWIALEDITADNGQLLVARGSHRLDTRIRGTNVSTPWLAHRGVWDRRMVAVPAAAGEAIIFDSALVHGSYPNHSSSARIAAAVAVAPAGADLVHYRAVDADTAEMLVVDKEFFVTQDVAQLPGGALSYASTARVPIGGTDFTETELGRRLDRQPLMLLDRLLGRTAARPDDSGISS